MLAISIIGFSKDNPKTRSVICHSSDTAIYAHILLELPKKLKRQDDLVYFWYEYGKIHKNTGYFSGKLVHGEVMYKDVDGKVVCSGSFNHGLKIGVWNFWNVNGGRTKTEVWNKGTLEKVNIYSTSGSIIREYDYVKNNVNIREDENATKEEKLRKKEERANKKLLRKQKTKGEERTNEVETEEKDKNNRNFLFKNGPKEKTDKNKVEKEKKEKDKQRNKSADKQIKTKEQKPAKTTEKNEKKDTSNWFKNLLNQSKTDKDKKGDKK